jgi:hypothetical protein
MGWYKPSPLFVLSYQLAYVPEICADVAAVRQAGTESQQHAAEQLPCCATEHSHLALAAKRVMTGAGRCMPNKVGGTVWVLPRVTCTLWLMSQLRLQPALQA